MTTACVLSIRFASGGNSLSYLGGGWAQSEPEFAWAIGTESHLVLPRLQPADEYILLLDVIPYTHATKIPSQSLTVSVNETIVGQARLSRPTLLGYRIPARLIGKSERVLVTLSHPDAASPKSLGAADDERSLAFAVSEAKLYKVVLDASGDSRRLPPGLMLTAAKQRSESADVADWAVARTGMSIADLAMRFESLGENCEFGLFQRQCDAEPLGLLRFSSTFMRNLIRGINDGFEGLGEIETIEPRLEGSPRREYMIHEKRYGLVYHTFVYEGQRSVWLMREQESARLKFLRRKFMEELQGTDKIFVYKLGSGASEEEIVPLHLALNRFSEATLLWVVPAEADRPAGTVEVVMPGLLKGYIDRFAPDANAHDLSFDGWLRICANAVVMDRLQRPSGYTGGPLASNDDGARAPETEEA